MAQRKFPDDFIPAPPRTDKGTLTTSEIVAMAWDDETSFDDIKVQSGLSEPEVIKVMRQHMQPSRRTISNALLIRGMAVMRLIMKNSAMKALALRALALL